MTVQSYLFQSPYSQPFQVGRPDPAQKSETNEQSSAMAETQKASPKSVNAQIAPTSGSGFSIDMGSLQQIGTSQGVQETQAMSRLAQARNAYAENQ